MAPSPDHIAIPLEEFFHQLQAAGFKMDTARKLRLLGLLEKNGSAHIGNIGDLKYRLAPFVATSEIEQKRFYTFFEQFLQQCKEDTEGYTPQETRRPVTLRKNRAPWFKKQKNRKWHRLMRQFGLIGFILSFVQIFALLILFQGPMIHPPFHTAGEILEGENIQFQSSTGWIDESTIQWEIKDKKADSILWTGVGNKITWKAAKAGTDIAVKTTAIVEHNTDTLSAESVFTVYCNNPPEIKSVHLPESPLTAEKIYDFSVETERDVEVAWIFDNRDTIFGNIVKYKFRKENISDSNNDNSSGVLKTAVEDAKALDRALKSLGDGRINTTGRNVQIKVWRKGERKYCINTQIENFDFSTDRPFLSYANLQYDNPRTTDRLVGWVWLFLLLPLVPAGWFLWRWWQARREKPVLKTDEELAAEHPIHDKAPYFIPYRSQNGKINVPPDFFRMADVLRRREAIERQYIDIPASVHATVSGGGFPTLLNKHDTSPPDYLFLIERSSAHDQQGRLFERLTTFFQKQDAPLTVFFHEGNFNSFWHEDNPGSVSIDYLQKQYANCRLVLIGTGHGLYNQYDPRLPVLHKHLLDKLLFWKKTLFLSTLPVRGWYAVEGLLHRHFLLFPADTDGIREGLEALETLEEYAPGPYTKWEESLARHRQDTNPRFQLWESADQHKSFLQHDPAAFKWLCGLAVTVLPDYALTIAIGKKMGIEVTHDRLLRLTRIPWLNKNEPDSQLRLSLLNELTMEEERIARIAVQEELEVVKENVAGGYAELEWKTNLAIHRFALQPENSENRQMLRDLMRMGLFSGGQLQELDGLAKRRLRPPGLEARGYGIEDYLNAPNEDVLAAKGIRSALSLIALTLGLLTFGWSIEHQWNQLETKQEASFFVQENIVVDSAMIWQNEAVRLANVVKNEKQYSIWSTSIQDTARIAENLFMRAIKKGTSNTSPQNYTLAIENRQAFWLNLGSQIFNFYLQDSAKLESLTGAMQCFAFTDTQSSADWYNDEMKSNSLHGYGLCEYYLYKGSNNAALLDSAKVYYVTLLSSTDSLFFDTLRTHMPINLQTLLVAEKVIKDPYSDNITDTTSTKGILSNIGLPKMISLRRWVPKVRNQGAIASVTGWAVGYYALTTTVARALNWSPDQLNQNAFSALFIYNQIRENYDDCSVGAYIDKALTLLQKQGDCKFSEFDTGNDCKKLPDEDIKTKALQYKIDDWLTLFGRDERPDIKIRKIKQALANGAPVIISLKIRENFAEITGSVWEPSIGDTTFHSSHAFTVIGYDDKKQAFEIVNSWGTGWGNKGFLWITYADLVKYSLYGFTIKFDPARWRSRNTDTDGDGIADKDDRCPDIKGIAEYGGCLATIKQDGRVKEDSFKVDYDLREKIWVVVVGIANYPNGDKLKFTDDDAFRVYTFFKSPEGGGLPDSQIAILLDEDASHANMMSILRKIFLKADENDRIVLYFSGRSSKDGLSPIDADSKNVVSYTELKYILQASKAKDKICFIDGILNGAIYQVPEDESRYAFFSAANLNENAMEDSGLRQGIFSYYLLRGLKGAADSNQDKIVTLIELFEYVSTKVKEYTANYQNPVFIGNYDPNLPVSRLR